MGDNVPLSGQTVTYIAISFIPSIAAFATLLALARSRRLPLTFVPGWLAAVALAPVIATFFAVRLLVTTFRTIAINGGGIAAVSAGMWEATQPLIATSYLACALAIVTSIIAIRAAGNQSPPEEALSRPGPSLLSVATLLLAASAIVGTRILLPNVSAFIFNAIIPSSPGAPSPGVGEVSRMISSRLALTAGMALGMTLALLVCLVLTAMISTRYLPRGAFARVFAVVAVLIALLAAANGLAFQSEAARLQRTVVTGQLTRQLSP